MSLNDENNYDLEKVYHAEIFQNREQVVQHGRYAKEKKINSLIREGNVEKLEQIFKQIEHTGIGRMSNNSFRQQLYAIIIGISTATRAAMDGGMYEEEAYTLSDIYIQKADCCVSTEELWKMYVRAVMDFAERAYKSKNRVDEVTSVAVQSSIDYILRNLHYNSNLNLKEIAENIGLSETYFSALFKKETGYTVSEFIQKGRVKEAKSLLQYSEYSLIEISQYLGFCSQSHFAQTFRKHEGMTPGQYRKKNFKVSW